MALRDILDRQANSIEYVLHTHGVRAQIDGGRLSTRLSHFHIVLPPGVRPSQLSPFIPEITGALGVTGCRLSVGESGAFLEVPRPDPVPVRLLPLVQRVAPFVPPATATLGLDSEGTPLLLRLSAYDVNPVLVTGDRSAGKSHLMRCMALALALHNSPERLNLVLLDVTGEGEAFRGMDTLPHLACPTSRGAVDSMVGLRWALRALSRRARMVEDDELHFDGDFQAVEDGEDNDDQLFEGTDAPEPPAIVVMVDGADLLCAGGNRRIDMEATQAVNKLIAEGSRHNIHLVVSAERPDLLAMVNTNWGARVAGWVASPEAARFATGVKGSGAQALLGGGDFVVALNADLIRFQAAGASDADVARAVEIIQINIDHAKRIEEAADRNLPEEGGWWEGNEEIEDNGIYADRYEASGHDRQGNEPVLLKRSWAGE